MLLEIGACLIIAIILVVGIIGVLWSKSINCAAGTTMAVKTDSATLTGMQTAYPWLAQNPATIPAYQMISISAPAAWSWTLSTGATGNATANQTVYFWAWPSALYSFLSGL